MELVERYTMKADGELVLAVHAAHAATSEQIIAMLREAIRTIGQGEKETRQ